MRDFFKFSALIFGTLISFSLFALPHLEPVHWKGQKWEYLVEHPRDIQHIDTVRMEEVLNTAGQHGWHLVNVTSAFHFYAFYFERPLQDHRLSTIRQRIMTSKLAREKREAKMMETIQKAVNTEQ